MNGYNGFSFDEIADENGVITRNGYKITRDAGSFCVSGEDFISYFATLEEAIDMADRLSERDNDEDEGVFLPIKRYIIISREIMAIVETFDTIEEVNNWLSADKESVEGSGVTVDYKVVDVLDGQ